MIANFVVNFLNTWLFTKLLLLTSQNLGGPNALLAPPPTKIGGGAVTLVSTGSGPHGSEYYFIYSN